MDLFDPAKFDFKTQTVETIRVVFSDELITVSVKRYQTGTSLGIVFRFIVFTRLPYASISSLPTLWAYGAKRVEFPFRFYRLKRINKNYDGKISARDSFDSVSGILVVTVPRGTTNQSIFRPPG